jgi:hypothetical protein
LRFCSSLVTRGCLYAEHPQIEALKRVNTHLYESLKRVVSGVNNVKLSLDSGVTDDADFARVSAVALTQNKIDPAKSSVLMKGSLPPRWCGPASPAGQGIPQTRNLQEQSLPPQQQALLRNIHLFIFV